MEITILFVLLVAIMVMLGMMPFDLQWAAYKVERKQ